MQSGQGKSLKWILEFETSDPTKNPLMGWESSSDTYTELKLEFSSKELAINYAKKNKIDYDLIEPKKRKTVKKSLNGLVICWIIGTIYLYSGYLSIAKKV